MSTIKKETHTVDQIKKGDIVNVFFWGTCIKENCLVVDLIKDHYFTKGLVIYLNGTNRETIDLENNDGLYVTKLN